LVDNALRASPPNSAVTFEFSAAVDGGLLLEIADSGIGTAPEVLNEINARLAAGNSAEIQAPRQMGLFVAGRLAARNGISVRLRPTFDSDTNAGITASIYFPAVLLTNVQQSTPEVLTERPRRLQAPEEPARHADQAATRTQQSAPVHHAGPGQSRPMYQSPSSSSDQGRGWNNPSSFDSQSHDDPR
ncbi:MAG: ATP-binding protein, partial [Rhodococcus sp. (in: high G+C Gram-positive bacteria)]|uniref:ATP-binding protein n=1 Tax=Rhodococcus sp. TaxID=1831 RepID=UPI003BB7102B